MHACNRAIIIIINTGMTGFALPYPQHGQVLQRAVPEAGDVEERHLVGTLVKVPGSSSSSSGGGSAGRDMRV
jgi:hypothetical protein